MLPREPDGVWGDPPAFPVRPVTIIPVVEIIRNGVIGCFGGGCRVGNDIDRPAKPPVCVLLPDRARPADIPLWWRWSLMVCGFFGGNQPVVLAVARNKRAANFCAPIQQVFIVVVPATSGR